MTFSSAPVWRSWAAVGHRFWVVNPLAAGSAVHLARLNSTPSADGHGNILFFFCRHRVLTTKLWEQSKVIVSATTVFHARHWQPVRSRQPANSARYPQRTHFGMSSARPAAACRWRRHPDDDSLTENLATPSMFSYTHTIHIHIHHNEQGHRVLPEILFLALFPHVRWSSPTCATTVMSAMLATWARAQVMHTVRPQP